MKEITWALCQELAKAFPDSDLEVKSNRGNNFMSVHTQLRLTPLVSISDGTVVYVYGLDKIYKLDIADPEYFDKIIDIVRDACKRVGR